MNRVPRLVLIDLSGTVHIEDDLIDGAYAALERLRDQGLPFRFVTNTSKESKSFLRHRLAQLGIYIAEEELFTSLSATKRYIQERSLRPLLFLEQDALKDFQDIDQTSPNAVVIGLAPSMFTYEMLTVAFNLLINGAELVAVNKSRYFRKEDGLVLGAGAFVSALEFSSGKIATVVGKPESSFFIHAVSDFPGVSPEDCIMIGDDVRDDVLGARAAGMMSILVKTGKYREGDEKTASPGSVLTANNLADAVDKIISAQEEISKDLKGCRP